MATAADIAADWQPTLVRAVICLDSRIVLEIERLTEQLEREKAIDEKTNRAPKAPGIAVEILELREVAKASEREFVFQSIGRRAYTDLIRQHPALPEQEENAGVELNWNTDTFPPALLAAACVEPTGTDLAWWTRAYNDWGLGQVTRIFQAALSAQGGVVEVPKATGASVMTSDSEPS